MKGSGHPKIFTAKLLQEDPPRGRKESICYIDCARF